MHSAILLSSLGNERQHFAALITAAFIFCISFSTSIHYVSALAATTASPESPMTDTKCLTQKMLISCSPGGFPGSITCGGGRVTTVALATELLLDWADFSSAAQASLLSLELSKPSSDLSLVTLDLSGTGLCNAKRSGVRLKISYAAFSAGPRLTLRGLSLPAVASLHLEGNIAINSDLLSGLPRLEKLGAAKNNISLSREPQARYSVTGASELNDIRILGSIHSVSYGTPLLHSLGSLQSVRISQGNMVILKSGLFVRLPSLRYLYLSENNINDLEAGSLAGLGSLEHLFLNSNGLKRLANYAFADLTSLKKLSLANNRLTSLQSNCLQGLTKLQLLDLSDNQLTQLPEMLFSQLHGLQTLNLQLNPGLKLEDEVNDTFCPLEGLKTLWIDFSVDCEKFGSQQFVQMIGNGKQAGGPRRKKYSCDISQMKPEQLPCYSWLDRLARRQKQLQQVLQHHASYSESEELPSTAGELKQQSTSAILLIIFGIICFVHVLTTAVTIFVCFRMRRRRREAGLAQRKSPSVSSPEEERSLDDASPGICHNGGGSNKDSSMLGRFHVSASGSGVNGGKGSKSDRGDPGTSNRLNVRDKNYDFNEDENHA